MFTKHMKRCPTSLTGQEMQIKTTTRYDFTPTGMALIEKTVMSVGEDVETLESSYIARGT